MDTITIGQAAGILRVSPQAVYRYVADGVLTRIPRGIRGVLLSRAEVEELAKPRRARCRRKRLKPVVDDSHTAKVLARFGLA